MLSSGYDIALQTWSHSCSGCLPILSLHKTGPVSCQSWMDEGLRQPELFLLDCWQLVDSERGTSHCLACVATQWTLTGVPNLRPHRWYWLKSMDHKTKHTGLNIARGPVGRRGEWQGGRSTEEGREESKQITLFKCIHWQRTDLLN